MLKRLRQTRISLAAKCQILFGTAVAAIIFAALFVPWQRMEQLTEQLNEKAAGAVADTVVADHVARQTVTLRERAELPGNTVFTLQPPPRSPSASTVPATTQPAPGTLLFEGQPFPAPRLVLAATAVRSPEKLTRFELTALSRLSRDPDRKTERRYYDSREGAEGFRYAVALYNTARCAGCHTTGISTDPATARSSTAPATGPADRSVDENRAPRASSRQTGAAATAPATSPTTADAPFLGIVSVDIPSQIKSREVLLNRVFLLVAGLIAGSLAIVIFYLITTRLILQPVRVLQETAEKVSQGDLNIRSDINTGDEFQVLSETFNVMLFNLKSSADQLRAVNKSLDLKLGQLAESNVALYESNRLKNEFLANVSHELRTPLNSILGFADLLKEQMQSGGEPKLARYLQNILNSGNHLLDLINDLLDLAKIEAGKMEVRAQPLSLSDLLDGLISLLKPLTEQKQLAIAVSVNPAVPIVRTDPAKLQQVLYNFLSNAIKFSPVGGRIELSAEKVADELVRLTVTDHGPGIEPDKHAMIFEKFRQLDGSVTRQHGGTGLGLAISRELATLMGGAVGLRSTPGDGASFWITIPVSIESSSQDVRGRLVLT